MGMTNNNNDCYVESDIINEELYSLPDIRMYSVKNWRKVRRISHK